jgi:hypothetical protein
MARLNRHDIAVVLIDKMFEISGHEVRFKDIEGRTDNWYQQYLMTEQQNQEWREWGKAFIKKQLRTNEKSAASEMAWFDLNYGLKIKTDGDND